MSDVIVIATHARVNQEVSFTCTVKVSDGIRHCDAIPSLSVKVVYNNEDIPIELLNYGLNQWRRSVISQHKLKRCRADNAGYRGKCITQKDVGDLYIKVQCL